VDACLDAAHTGNVGDGKVFVLELHQAIRIRTRETKSDALR
jgi:nitrogen regulatory protein PII